jgi:Ca2+-binding EF-hand superfamily protein
MVRHLAVIAVLALLPVPASAQQCTTDANAVVTEIYRRVLGRQTTSDANAWADQLRNGSTVRNVIRQIAESEEYRRRVTFGNTDADRQRTVTLVYRHLQLPSPNEEALGARVATLQAQGMVGLIHDVINLPEYMQSTGDWRVPGSNVTYCHAGTGLVARGRNAPSFDRADRNRDGRITVSEWDDTRQAFVVADANRDNVLSRDEFDRATGVTGAVGTSGSRNEQFDVLDRNRNNRIERNEWRDSADSFSWLDRNGDGWLSRGEVVGRRTQ